MRQDAVPHIPSVCWCRAIAHARAVSTPSSARPQRATRPISTRCIAIVHSARALHGRCEPKRPHRQAVDDGLPAPSSGCQFWVSRSPAQPVAGTISWRKEHETREGKQTESQGRKRATERDRICLEYPGQTLPHHPGGATLLLKPRELARPCRGERTVRRPARRSRFVATLLFRLRGRPGGMSGVAPQTRRSTAWSLLGCVVCSTRPPWGYDTTHNGQGARRWCLTATDCRRVRIGKVCDTGQDLICGVVPVPEEAGHVIVERERKRCASRARRTPRLTPYHLAERASALPTDPRSDP